MSDYPNDFHPSRKKPEQKTNIFKVGKKLPPLKDSYPDMNNIAGIRAAEKHNHELAMIKDLLTAILNALDLQQMSIDEIYDMIDCYITSLDDDE